MKKGLVLLVFLLLLIGAGTLVYIGRHRQQAAERYYSGTIEATQSALAFEVGGRVREVLIDEGQQALKGACLARLDASEYTARQARAQADLDRALNTHDQLEAMRSLYRATLPAEVEKASAAVAVLRSRLADLESGYRGQEVAQARLAVAAAESTLADARKNKERYDALYQKRVVSEKEKDAVGLKYETTLTDYQRAQKALDLLTEGFRRESIAAARAQLAEGLAVLKQAQSNLKKIDVVEKEGRAALAQVEASRAALDLARIQLAHTCLKAPFTGTVITRSVEPGEVVSSGREVFSLSDLSTVDLKIFVAESDIGQVKPGRPVEVKTDSFPSKTYAGQIAYISSEAEFTPKIIQTRKERVKLVYLVKVTLPNPDLELKPGMPADAWLR